MHYFLMKIGLILIQVSKKLTPIRIVIHSFKEIILTKQLLNL